MFLATTDGLLDRAGRRTGLNDYGDPRFIEGLRTLIASFETERDIRLVGRRFIKTTLENGLVNRLLVNEALRRHPEIAESPVRRPLFIVGLSRTGTTFLHNLLALAEDARAPRAWETLQPAPPCPPGGPEEKRRMRRTARLLWLLQKAAPGLRKAHPIRASDHEECYPLINNTFASPAFSLHYGLPAYTEWLTSLDPDVERRVYREYRTQLQILQAGRPARRWVLKSAVHLFFLRALLEEFPDAGIVQTHRDPLRVIPSLCSMVSCFRTMVYAKVSSRALGRELLEKSRGLLERGRDARRGPLGGRVLDIEFDRLVADPIGQVRRIHEVFDLGWSGTLERRLRSWMAVDSTGRHPDHRYSMAQFGLDEETILSGLSATAPSGPPS